MEVYRRSSGLLLLLGLSLLATTLQGVQGEVEVEGPSESECRPYIEKALKQLETGEGAVDTSGEQGDSKEDIPTVEITDDSSHQEGDGEKDDADDDGQESKENVIVSEKKPEREVRPSVIQKLSWYLKSLFQKTPKTEEAANENKRSEDKQDDASSEQGNQPPADDADSKEAERQDDSKEDGVKESVEEQEKEGDSKEGDSKEGDSKEGDSKEGDSKEGDSKEGDSKEEDDAKVNDKEGSEEDKADSAEQTKEEVDDEKQADDEDSKENQNEQESQEQTDETQDDDKSDEKKESIEEIIEAVESQILTQSQNQQDDDSEEVVQADNQQDDKQSEEEQPQADEAAPESTEDTKEDTKDDSKEEDTKDDSKEEDKDDSKADDQDETKDDSKENDSKDESQDVTKDETVENTEESKENVVESKEDKGDDKSEENAEPQDDTKEDSKEESKEETTEQSHGGKKDEDSKEESKLSKEGKEEGKDDDKEGSKEDSKESKDDKSAEKGVASKEKDDSDETDDSEGDKSSEDGGPVEELSFDIEIPTELRPRDHVEHLLKLDDESSESEMLIDRVSEITLRDLKKLYENAIKPLETVYKYRDLSNRHFGDSEIFSKPLILFMGPWSGGKSSIINYLTNNEYNETSIRTGAEPSPAYFNILMYGEEPEVIDGTELAADHTFSGLQKFGQGLEERLRGVKLPSKLLEKVNIVEIPGILEVRKQVSRVFPFNDACQWFIDRGDIIFLIYDPSKLDVGPETEAILDQLKGREHQTRIILNKADQVKPEELMRVQGALIWNISPLMSSPQPPIMYTTSLWSRPYESWAPVRLLQAQERAFLRDLRGAVDKRIENKIASARRFAVRVRNHAKMVDCYLTTYYNHKSVFGNRKQVADAIIEHPQDYHIYEGLSTLTNISRYDLPDPDVYRDFFKLNPLYEFQQLSATCTYFRGCPINRLDIAIAYDLPELLGTHKKRIENALSEAASGPPQTAAPGS